MKKPDEVISLAPAWVGQLPAGLFLALYLFSRALIIVHIFHSTFYPQGTLQTLVSQFLQHPCSVNIKDKRAVSPTSPYER